MIFLYAEQTCEVDLILRVEGFIISQNIFNEIGPCFRIAHASIGRALRSIVICKCSRPIITSTCALAKIKSHIQPVFQTVDDLYFTVETIESAKSPVLGEN